MRHRCFPLCQISSLVVISSHPPFIFLASCALVWITVEVWFLGIRARLLLLAVGIAVPLMIVGVADLRGMWAVSRAQLDDSVRQQAELAALAFERWVDAQRQPLVTIAAIASDQKTGASQKTN